MQMLGPNFLSNQLNKFQSGFNTEKWSKEQNMRSRLTKVDSSYIKYNKKIYSSIRKL